MLMAKYFGDKWKKSLNVSWLSEPLSEEIYISIDERGGGGDVNNDRGTQAITVIRASGGFPGKG